MKTFYALFTDQKVTPATGEGSAYYHPGQDQSLIIVQKEGGNATFAYSTHGQPHVTVGEHVTVMSDQSGRRLGIYRVLGYMDNRGITFGDVPYRSMRHAVAK